MTDELIQEDNIDTLDPNADYLDQLVGEGKKFKSPEDLARGKYEADLYIKTLTARMDEMRNDYTQLRQDYNSRAKLEEVLDQLKTQQSGSDSNTLANDAGSKPEMKPEDVTRMISEEIKRTKQLDQEETNFRVVQGKLKERFGNNKEALNSHLQDLGLSEDFARELARKHPNVFIRTMGLDQQPAKEDDFLPPPRSSQRRDTFAPKTTKRTWDYYQKLKKNNPDQYFSKDVTNQMMEDYKTLGEAFEDGDFHDRRFR